jgi:cation diffusion facilitator CzcD-associated flavoprotein CzcO
MSEITEHRDAVVVGAGFAGLYMLHKLRNDMGLEAEVFETGTRVGGTWFWNRYPGARCDTESYVYCYSFSRELLDEWVWEAKYPTFDELQRYLEHVAQRFDLERSISFGTTVDSAVYQEETNEWLVTTTGGRRILSTYFITGVGLLASATHMPQIEGMDRFEGMIQHTGQWSANLDDLAGKRVGVIGTGSSGVQLIPELAKICSEVTVFQRTPQFTVPARHENFSVEDFYAIRADYDEVWRKVHRSAGGFPWQHNGRSVHDVTDEEREAILEDLWARGGFQFIFGSFRDLLTDRQANDYVSEFVRRKIRDRVADPATAEVLLPRDHPFGAKRPIIDTDYFETYNQPHVTLVDLFKAPITNITSTGLQTADAHYELDVIVFATGFDAVTGPILRIDPQGVDGRKLSELWCEGPASFMGLGVADFPNMFMITGPGSTFGNMPVVIQHHVEWIAGCIDYARRTRASSVEVEESAQEGWMRRISRESARLVSSLTDSWFTGANIPGKPRAVYFFLGSYGKYRAELDVLATEGYPGLIFNDQHAALPAGATTGRAS